MQSVLTNSLQSLFDWRTFYNKYHQPGSPRVLPSPTPCPPEYASLFPEFLSQSAVIVYLASPKLDYE